MGKLILVLGENNSGKSKFSEEMISKIEGNRYYIATMIPATDENYDRIKKHKKQRSFFIKSLTNYFFINLFFNIIIT